MGSELHHFQALQQIFKGRYRKLATEEGKLKKFWNNEDYDDDAN